VVLEDKVHVCAVVNPVRRVEAQVTDRVLSRTPGVRQAVLNVQMKLVRGVDACKLYRFSRSYPERFQVRAMR
jgi:hypothetical protein